MSQERKGSQQKKGNKTHIHKNKQQKPHKNICISFAKTKRMKERQYYPRIIFSIGPLRPNRRHSCPSSLIENQIEVVSLHFGEVVQ